MNQLWIIVPNKHVWFFVDKTLDQTETELGWGAVVQSDLHINHQHPGPKEPVVKWFCLFVCFLTFLYFIYTKNCCSFTDHRLNTREWLILDSMTTAASSGGPLQLRWLQGYYYYYYYYNYHYSFSFYSYYFCIFLRDLPRTFSLRHFLLSSTLTKLLRDHNSFSFLFCSELWRHANITELHMYIINTLLNVIVFMKK